MSTGPVGDRRRVVVLALGALVFLAGWGVLAWLAVLRAQDEDWGLVTVAAVAAAASLFVSLLLGTRMRAVRRGELVARRAPSHRR